MTKEKYKPCQKDFIDLIWGIKLEIYLLLLYIPFLPPFPPIFTP